MRLWRRIFFGSFTTLLTSFLELFQPLPGNKYLQVTSKPDGTTEALQTLLAQHNGEFHLAHYLHNEQNPSCISDKTKVQRIDSLNKPFRALPRDYDMIIFKDIFHLHTNPNGLIKIAYTALANTANIIIMEPKGTLDTNKTKELLELFEFRASNEIDVHPLYDLVIAKKMHMWGNGL